MREVVRKFHCVGVRSTPTPEAPCDASRAMDVDGESFAMMTTATKASMPTPVSLDLRVYECDRFDAKGYATAFVDEAGIRIDSNGDPTSYAFLPTILVGHSITSRQRR